MRNVRKWLREIEKRLIPVNLAANWTTENLEKRYKEQEVMFYLYHLSTVHMFFKVQSSKNEY